MLIIIGAKEIISKSFRKYANKINEIKELNKTAILGTTHVLGKVLMLRYFTQHAK
jgi:hypothetical protein